MATEGLLEALAVTMKRATLALLVMKTAMASTTLLAVLLKGEE